MWYNGGACTSARSGIFVKSDNYQIFSSIFVQFYLLTFSQNKCIINLESEVMSMTRDEIAELNRENEELEMMLEESEEEK